MPSILFESGRLRTAALIAVVALALPGCATVEGVMGTSHPGYQDDGTYVLSAQDEGLGCRALQERSRGLQAQMQELSTRAVEEMQAVPNTIAAAWGRLVGSPGDAVPAVAQYNEARAESAALDATITQKRCGTVETASIKH